MLSFCHHHHHTRFNIIASVSTVYSLFRCATNMQTLIAADHVLLLLWHGRKLSKSIPEVWICSFASFLPSLHQAGAVGSVSSNATRMECVALVLYFLFILFCISCSIWQPQPIKVSLNPWNWIWKRYEMATSVAAFTSSRSQVDPTVISIVDDPFSSAMNKNPKPNYVELTKRKCPHIRAKAESRYRRNVSVFGLIE